MFVSPQVVVSYVAAAVNAVQGQPMAEFSQALPKAGIVRAVVERDIQPVGVAGKVKACHTWPPGKRSNRWSSRGCHP